MSDNCPHGHVVPRNQGLHWNVARQALEPCGMTETPFKCYTCGVPFGFLTLKNGSSVGVVLCECDKKRGNANAL